MIDADTKWFFRVHVLTGLGSHDCDRNMPVVSGRNVYCVNILVLEQLPEIVIVRTVPVFPAVCFASAGYGVADGNNL